ncbi:MAG: hypothetical protein LBK95_00540, partial [Bifidobacteriaceae bacterium]|nr:hypothetical protein [Bifidobacteriaceae bacterium]
MFLTDFAADGWTTALRSYQGYLHLVPRAVVGVAASVAPLELFAATLTALTCAVAGACAAITFLATRGVLTHTAPRIVLATIPVAAPLLPVEVLGNAANLHWFGLWLAPWTMLYRPRRWSVSVALALTVLAAALTEIQVVVFLPLMTLTWRRRMSAPVNAALVLGVAAQVVTTVVYPRRSRPPGLRLTFMDLVDSTLAQAVLGAHTADMPAVAESLSRHGMLAGWLGLVPFVCAGMVALWMGIRHLPAGARRRRWLAALTVCALAAAGLLAAAAIMNPDPRFAMNSSDPQDWPGFLFSRYAVVPGMFLLAVPALTADALLARRPANRSTRHLGPSAIHITR